MRTGFYALPSPQDLMEAQCSYEALIAVMKRRGRIGVEIVAALRSADYTLALAAVLELMRSAGYRALAVREGVDFLELTVSDQPLDVCEPGKPPKCSQYAWQRRG